MGAVNNMDLKSQQKLTYYRIDLSGLVQARPDKPAETGHGTLFACF
jgi:hypothetical protein